MPNSSDLPMPGAALSYRVVIDGVQDGHTLEHVAASLAEMFRRTAEQMHTLMAAPRAIIKKQVDFASAQRFQAALERCGCIAVIEPDTTDFSTLVLCHHVSPGPGIAINAPEAWVAGMDGDTFELQDPQARACLRAVGVTSSTLSIREWGEQRLRWVAEDMPYLRQVRAPYRLEGAGWDERVQGVAAEYRGTFPGTGEYSHYLVLCLRSTRSLVCVTIHAPAAVFDAHQALYRWLLQTQLDVCDAALAPVPTQAHDEAMQRWLRYNEERPSRPVADSPADSVADPVAGSSAAAGADAAAAGRAVRAVPNITLAVDNTRPPVSPLSPASPYAPPAADMSEAPLHALPAETARQLASGQKLVIWTIVMNFVAAAFRDSAPVVMLALSFVVLAMALTGIARMAKGLGIGMGARIGLIVLMLAPLINILVLLLLSRSATRKLREAGYQVGLLGAKV